MHATRKMGTHAAATMERNALPNSALRDMSLPQLFRCKIPNSTDLFQQCMRDLLAACATRNFLDTIPSHSKFAREGGTIARQGNLVKGDVARLKCRSDLT